MLSSRATAITYSPISHFSSIEAMSYNSLSSLCLNSYTFWDETFRNFSHFVLLSKVTMDPGARRLFIKLAGNSDLTNLAQWFDHPPQVMETNISEQRFVCNKLFNSLPEYSAGKFGRHYHTSKGKSVVWLCLPSPLTKFWLCSDKVVTYWYSLNNICDLNPLFSMPSVQLLLPAAGSRTAVMLKCLVSPDSLRLF